MAKWLRDLTPAKYQFYVEHLDQLSQKLAQWLPQLNQYKKLIQLDEFTTSSLNAADCTLAEVDAPGMPGRKRLQAGAFTAALLPLKTSLFDWCSGSGHLARTLAAHTWDKITGWEWNQDLVNKGNQLAKKAAAKVQLEEQDVLNLQGTWPKQTHSVALHACGDLHRQLLKKSVKNQLPRLSLSPCCYHLGSAKNWHPLSNQAKQSLLHNLPLTSLNLAVQETVTAPKRVTRQREALNTWRLGFDGLQRHVRQQDKYLPLASCSPKTLQAGFKAFCQKAAASQGFTLPATTDYLAWETYGQARLEEVKRYELLRHLFRRPLEIWLVLDYLLFLEEAGYQVKLGTFCERKLTPRNLLLDASLS